MGERLIGVGAIFSSAHKDVLDGSLHGHTYEVVAWWPADPPRDARVLQAQLREMLAAFDHKVLDDIVLDAWAEKLAEHFRDLIGCAEVEVNRPLERIYAKVRG